MIPEHVTKFIAQFHRLMREQPPASDLDGCDKFMRNLNALYARWAQLNGEAEALLAEITYIKVKEMSDEQYKRIKNSSTLTTQYVQGQNKVLTAKLIEIQSIGYVLRSTADNYRTLISSYRLEREMDNKTVRNTGTGNNR